MTYNDLRHVAEDSYVGCPHCGGPVNVKFRLLRQTDDFLTVLSYHWPKDPHAMLDTLTKLGADVTEERIMGLPLSQEWEKIKSLGGRRVIQRDAIDADARL